MFAAMDADPVWADVSVRKMIEVRVWGGVSMCGDADAGVQDGNAQHLSHLRGDQW